MVLSQESRTISRIGEGIPLIFYYCVLIKSYILLWLLHLGPDVAVGGFAEGPVFGWVGVEAATSGAGLGHAEDGGHVLDVGGTEKTAAFITFEKYFSSKHICIVLIDS